MKYLRNIVWVVLVLAAGLSFVYLFVPDAAKYLDLASREKKLTERIDEEERKNTAYTKEVNDLEKNPVYIEKVAREKLGLSRPEEIIYKFNKGSEPAAAPAKQEESKR